MLLSIKKALGDIQCLEQYYVDGYRIDLYIPCYRIAVECDEHDHKNYDSEKDNQRTNTITQKLNCKWVRFDPYNKSFSIECVICDIYRIIREMDSQVMSNMEIRKVQLQLELELQKYKLENERHKLNVERHKMDVELEKERLKANMFNTLLTLIQNNRLSLEMFKLALGTLNPQAFAYTTLAPFES